MFRVMIQVGLSSMVFLFSTVVALYEGSNILQDSHEWKYPAILSQWLNGGVANQSDILLPDYYIYAAKFFPTFRNPHVAKRYTSSDSNRVHDV